MIDTPQHFIERFAPEEWSELRRRNSLSPQQFKLLGLLMNGLQDREIAEAMRIGLPTVRTHMTRMFARIGASDRIEVILKVLRQFHEQCSARDCKHVRE